MKVSSGRELQKAEVIASQRILNAHGLAVPHWPVEWGGRGWSAVQRYIFTEELQRNAVPLPLQFNCYMVGPVIAAFGSQTQKERFLPRAANLDDWWCQGFSEPNAGSDLAGLTTSAVRVGDTYVVNGQKTWTTMAQHADWIFCLVRTNPSVKKQAGISFLLVDMKTPGIVVRPIRTIDGGEEINEVFFDDVVVPVENLVGQENRGWDYAKFLLSNERSGIARIGMSKERLDRTRQLAQQTPDGHGTMVWNDPMFRARFSRVHVELKALELTQMRMLVAEVEGVGDAPNPVSSLLKIKGSELQQATTELLLELAGPHALPFLTDDEHADALGELAWATTAAPTYFNMRKVSIYGGANEIQRNIVARTVLGL